MSSIHPNVLWAYWNNVVKNFNIPLKVVEADAGSYKMVCSLHIGHEELKMRA